LTALATWTNIRAPFKTYFPQEAVMRTVIAITMFATFVAAAPAADLFAGAWKLDPSKSKNNWGLKSSQSMTRTYTPTSKGGYDIKVEGVNGEGEAVNTNLQAAGDVEIPVTGTSAPVVKMLGATHVRSRRISDNKLVATYLKDGKPIGTSTSEISSDGRTMTMTLEGTSADGKKLMGTNVYQKQ
jgi:hypothetical protein